MIRRFFLVLIIGLVGSFYTIEAQDRVTAYPDSVKIITADIDHFWKAFDMLGTKTNSADSLTAIKTIFINPASAGLAEYMKASNCYASCYLDAIRIKKSDYLKIRQESEELKNKKDILVQYLQKFKQLYPSLKIPTICLTIGKFEVGGTQFENTLFVGCEVDLKQHINIPVQTMHELAHFQQKNQNPRTNLEMAMIEGGAEFVSYQVTGKRTISKAWAYGNTNEPALWAVFRPRLDSAAEMKWFLDIPDSSTNQPGSLGYYIGFKICASYLRIHSRKKEAMINLIEMEDPKKIFLESGYIQ